MLWSRITRRLRTLLGLGWSAAEFERRYQAKSENAWGYKDNPEHAARARRIQQAFPARPVLHLFEAGCAEGFLTRQLAARAAQVTACDLSPEAVRRAAEYCAVLSHVQFATADIRHELPPGPFDTAVFSDVLYYLSSAENRALALRLHHIMPAPRTLLIANEWNDNYRDLTHPKIAVECFTDTGLWTCSHIEEYATAPGQLHVIAVLK
jgi:2-polyprenyl-3-methyl-5-hydroxy-6-metoxy-1,4-benzoquinol methylase